MNTPYELGPGMYRSQNMDPEGPSVDINALELPSEVNVPIETPELQAHRDAVVSWSQEVADIRKDILQRRNHLESQLAHAIMEGTVLWDEARRQRSQIQNEIGKGVLRSYNYYTSTDPTRDRSQLYYATVDDEGNIWGEFMHKPRQTGTPHNPLPAGRYLVRKNPTLRKR